MDAAQKTYTTASWSGVNRTQQLGSRLGKLLRGLHVCRRFRCFVGLYRMALNAHIPGEYAQMDPLTSCTCSGDSVLVVEYFCPTFSCSLPGPWQLSQVTPASAAVLA